MRRIWGGGGSGGLGVNDVLMKDVRLSVPARGLAVHLLLLPERAQPDRRRLAARPGESADSIEGYLRELEDAGYVRRRIVWDRRGRAFEEVTVYARAVGGEAGEVEGRVFHWLASVERARSAVASAERAREPERDGEDARTGDAANATAESPVEVQGGGDRRTLGGQGEPVPEPVPGSEPVPVPVPEPESESESESESAPEPVAAGSGGGRGSASVRP
ncbi:hypothetical protein [Yinghuangia sp. YIM S09857]|uniref:hypothetical protein n=1 Tax=Yinghuangia sp. YIM S09857 TaxID=3436929 RepID=UPI003F535816